MHGSPRLNFFGRLLLVQSWSSALRPAGRSPLPPRPSACLGPPATNGSVATARKARPDLRTAPAIRTALRISSALNRRLMNGESDRMVPSKNTVDLDRRLPNSQLVLYRDAGHGGVFQFHEDFVKRALEFLS